MAHIDTKLKFSFHTIIDVKRKNHIFIASVLYSMVFPFLSIFGKLLNPIKIVHAEAFLCFII